jgi:enterochelin esterase-like enzyme
MRRLAITAFLVLAACASDGSPAAPAPALDSRTPDDGVSRYRAIAGVSMGGYAAAHLGLEHSGRFDVVACAGGLVDFDHFLFTVHDYYLGGFNAEKNLPWTYEKLPTEGQTVLDRDGLADFFQDLSHGLGNVTVYDPKQPYFPPGATKPAGESFLGVFDREYNPDGKLPAITFLDGDRGDRPMEVLLAIDRNRNGVRDPGEPVLRQLHEPYRDVGADGVPSASEPGYDAILDPDPSRDDYDPVRNPAGTEGNLRHDAGEPFDDTGLDGVASTRDFGEGNGAWDANPNVLRYHGADPRRLAAKADLGRISIWLDAGIRDVFQFDRETDRFAGELRRLGSPVAVFDGFDRLPGASGKFDAAKVAWTSLPRHVYVRYGDPRASAQAIADGDGGHVGDFDTLFARFASVFSFVSAKIPGGDVEPADPNATTRVERFTSRALGREMKVAIFLPPGYEEEANARRRYPVVYLLHGYGQKPEDMLAPLVLLVGPAMRAGRMQKMIVVVPDGHTLRGTGSAYVNHVAPAPGDTGRYADYVMQDLLPLIETKYRTRARER